MPRRSRPSARRPLGRPRKHVHAVQAFSVRMPADVLQVLRHYAVDNKKSVNDVVVDVLSEWTNRPELQAYVSWVKTPRGQ